MARNIQSHEKQGLPPRLLYPAKLSFRIEGQIKSFPDKKKTKGVHHHKTNIIRNVTLSSLRRKRKKNMKNKMATNTYLSTIESKKQNKQAEQKRTHRYREQSDGCQMGEVLGGWVKR